LPFNCNPVRSILAPDPHEGRKPLWPDLLQPDQADSSDRIALEELRLEIGWKDFGYDIGINPIVQQDTPSNDAFNRGDVHCIY
ncbi:MAG: hypothetical protein ACI9QL_004362, partial [Candidatus Omnitrophota bacterium]